MEHGELAAQFINHNIKEMVKLAGGALKGAKNQINLKLRKAHNNYVKNIKEKYYKSKSFFIRDRAVDLYDYYIPVDLGDDFYHLLLETPSFSECISSGKFVLINGSGGCGKSVFLRHLLLNSIKEGQYIPVFIELRDLNSSHLDLSSMINKSLCDNGFDLPIEYIEKAKISGHFTFILDGFDEVIHSQRQSLISEIKSMLSCYRDCPIIISSRPDDLLTGVNEFNKFAIMPLDKNKAVCLIDKLKFDDVIKLKFLQELKTSLFDKHQSFLSNPLLLSIMLLTYG